MVDGKHNQLETPVLLVDGDVDDDDDSGAAASVAAPLPQHDDRF